MVRWSVQNSFMHQLKDTSLWCWGQSYGIDSPVNKIWGSGNQEGEWSVSGPLAVIILTYTIFTSLCHDFEPASLNSLFLSRWLLPPMTQQWFHWTKRWVSQLATFGVSCYWTKNKHKERICCSGLRDGPWLSSRNRVTGTYQGQEGVFITQRIPLGVS